MVIFYSNFLGFFAGLCLRVGIVGCCEGGNIIRYVCSGQRDRLRFFLCVRFFQIARVNGVTSERSSKSLTSSFKGRPAPGWGLRPSYFAPDLRPDIHSLLCWFLGQLDRGENLLPLWMARHCRRRAPGSVVMVLFSSAFFRVTCLRPFEDIGNYTPSRLGRKGFLRWGTKIVR